MFVLGFDYCIRVLPVVWKAEKVHYLCFKCFRQTCCRSRSNRTSGSPRMSERNFNLPTCIEFHDLKVDKIFDPVDCFGMYYKQSPISRIAIIFKQL